MDDLTAGMSRSRRIRRSAEEWREIFSEFVQSGQTRKQFCAERNVKVSTFSRWRERLRDDSHAGAPNTEDSIFVELASQTRKPSAVPWDVELELGGGVVLRLRQGAC